MTLRVVLAQRALEARQGLLNRRIAEQVDQYITGLAIDPEEQGWPLVGELKDYRCLRPPGGWFRIVYRVGVGEVEVVLVSVGQTHLAGVRDVRTLARTLFSERLLR